MSKELDMKNLRFLPIEKIPPRKRRSKWREIFSRIPKGKALVLNEDEASYASVRSSLKSYKEKGEFQNIVIYSRRDLESGKRMIYVLNP